MRSGREAEGGRIIGGGVGIANGLENGLVQL